MANLDVNDLFTDPDLVSQFQVQRAAEVIDTHGRAQLAQLPIRTLVGVITPASAEDMVMLPEGTRISNTISIYSKYRLEGPSTTTHPDTIFWQGNVYVVSGVNSYTNFGRGFTHAIATLKDMLMDAMTGNVTDKGE